jgi:hypothetical protein
MLARGAMCLETHDSRGFQWVFRKKLFLFFFGCKLVNRVLLSRPSLGRNASRHPGRVGTLKSPESDVSGQQEGKMYLL